MTYICGMGLRFMTSPLVMSFGGIFCVSRKRRGGFILEEIVWQCLDMATKPLAVRAR